MRLLRRLPQISSVYKRIARKPSWFEGHSDIPEPRVFNKSEDQSLNISMEDIQTLESHNSQDLASNHA